MKFYKTIAYLGALSFFLVGIITIGSIIYGTDGIYINLILGMIFIGIAYYLYAKAKSFLKLMAQLKVTLNENQVTSKSIARFLLIEKIFSIASLLIGIMVLSGAVSRAFGENLPIFG